MKKSVYIKTSMPSYLTPKPSRDAGVAAWQQIAGPWWDEAPAGLDLFTSEFRGTLRPLRLGADGNRAYGE